MTLNDLLKQFYEWEKEKNDDDNNKKPIEFYYNEHIKKQGA